MDQARAFAEGIRQFERWRSTRSPADLEAAVASLAGLEAARPDDPGVRFWAGLLLAMALGDRYELSNSVDDIDGAIERLKRVVARPDPPPPVGDDDMDTYRIALGRALANRIDMYGRPGGPPPAGDAEFLAELQTAVDALAVAASTTAELVTPAERAEAAALRAHLVPKLLLTQGIVGRKAGRLADIPELERVLRDLPVDHPNRAQLILELGLAHMHLVLRPGAAPPSSPRTDHRVPAVTHLSSAVELLDPGYPERAKAIAFLAHLSLTRRPDSPDVAAASVRELAAQALGAPGLDPECRRGPAPPGGHGREPRKPTRRPRRLGLASQRGAGPGEESRADGRSGRVHEGDACRDPGRLQWPAQESVRVIAEPR